MDIPGGQVLQNPSPLVLVLDAHGLMRPRWQRGVAAMTDLNAGLLIGAKHVLVRPEWLALPLAGVRSSTGPARSRKCGSRGKIQQRQRQGRRASCTNSRQMLVRAGVTSWVPRIGDFDTEFAEAVAIEPHVAIGGWFTRQRHDQRPRGGFARQWPTAARPILEPIAAGGHEPAEPAAGGGSAHPLPIEPGRGCPKPSALPRIRRARRTRR